jgi:hypothetical protein
MMFIGFLILFLLFFCCPNSIVFAVTLNVVFFKFCPWTYSTCFFIDVISWVDVYCTILFWCVCIKCFKNFQKLLDNKLYTSFICDFWMWLFSTTPSLNIKKYTLLMFNDKAPTIVVLFEMFKSHFSLCVYFCYKDINNYLVKL